MFIQGWPGLAGMEVADAMLPDQVVDEVRSLVSCFAAAGAMINDIRVS